MATRTYTAQSQDYMSPKELYLPLLDFMGLDKFKTDIACSNMNIPAELYRTPEGEFSAEAFNSMFKLSNRTGLDGGFGEGVHFCNPPFREARHFIKVAVGELAKEPNSRFWFILPSDRMETKYYRDYILKNPNCFIVFLPKAGFLVPNKPLDKPIASVKVMYVYFGKDAKETAQAFNEIYGEHWAVVYNELNTP